MYSREIIDNGIFCFGTMTRVLGEGEKASTSTVQIYTNPIPCPEEYETEVEVSSAEGLT